MNDVVTGHEQWASLEHTDILYFIDLAPAKVGGVELFCRALAIALERRGLSITFVFSAPPAEAVCVLLDRPNVQHLVFQDQLSFSLSSIRRLRVLVRYIRPATVMYCFGGILRPLPWICKLAGVRRVIYNDHASRFPFSPAASSAKLFAKRIITRPVTSVIAVSEYVAECNRNERMHRAPICTIPNPVDLGRRNTAASGQHFLAQQGIPQGRRIVSQLSSLIEEKGIDTLLYAAEIVLRQNKNVHFIIGGEGSGRTQYERLAKDLGISDNVTFTGKINDPIASGFYPATDVFCLASRWYEAWGLVLIEAMSFAVPVVATRIGGIPEFVRDGVDGYLCQGRPEPFAQAITKLLQDDALRRTMGAAAREHVERDFEMSDIAERYVRVLAGDAPAPQKGNAAGASRGR